MTQALITRDEFLRQSIPGDAFAGFENSDVDEAIQWASSEACSYIRKRHFFPLVSWGEDVKRAVSGLVQFYLMTHRGFRPGSGNNEIAIDLRDQSLAWLKLLARGEIEADIVDSTPDTDEEGSLSDSDEPISFRMTTGSGSSGSGCCE